MNNNLPDIDNCTVAVIGLGYVGMPLALEIALCNQNDSNEVPKSNRLVIGF